MQDKPESTTGPSSGKGQSASAFQSDASAGSASGSGRGSSAGGGVSQTADRAKQTISDVASHAGDTVASRLDTQKDRAADRLQNVAQALRQTSDQLRNADERDNAHEYIASAANRVERVSDYLRTTSTRDMVDGVEQFARRQPALFVGGAFVLGVLAVRFLKSSRRATSGDSARTSYRRTATSEPQAFERDYSSAQHMSDDDYSPPPARPPARGRGGY